MNTHTLLLLAACIVAVSGFRVRCNDCGVAPCPTSLRCPYGRVTDACGCCNVCGMGPGHECDELLKCGRGLTCRMLVKAGKQVCVPSNIKF